MMTYNYRKYILLLTVFLTVNFLNTEMANAQNAEDEIRRLRKLSNDARKTDDLDVISKLFTNDIIIVKGDGGELNGLEAVNQYMIKQKKQSPGLYFERLPDKIIVAKSNKMAWEEGTWSGFNKDGPLANYAGRYSMMWLKTDESWKMRSQQFVNLR